MFRIVMVVMGKKFRQKRKRVPCFTGEDDHQDKENHNYLFQPIHYQRSYELLKFKEKI
jgi:hypothetical protein